MGVLCQGAGRKLILKKIHEANKPYNLPAARRRGNLTRTLRANIELDFEKVNILEIEEYDRKSRSAIRVLY